MTTHQGGCHCGAVRYEAHNINLEQVITCDCSMCGKSGSWLCFIPTEEFTLRSGEEHLTDYLFNSKTIHHLFCSTCGIKSFARGTDPSGKEMIAINVRCLDDIDLQSLHPTWYNGKAA